jgi:hypothetical protein
MTELIALHRYWLYADRLRLCFKEALSNSNIHELVQRAGPLGVLWFELTPPGVFMSFWYGALYVVIEGYRDLKLSDPEIDEFLQSPNVDYLRLFGMAHFIPARPLL